MRLKPEQCLLRVGQHIYSQRRSVRIGRDVHPRTRKLIPRLPDAAARGNPHPSWGSRRLPSSQRSLISPYPLDASSAETERIASLTSPPPCPPRSRSEEH